MDLTLFAAVKKRLNWLGQRQEILSQNISNADTPGYKAKDLKPYSFKEVLRREHAQLNMVRTDGESHLPGQRKRLRDFLVEDERHPYETAPNGNSVVLEEQMGKVNETQEAHRLTVELYKKHMNMLRIASSSR